MSTPTQINEAIDLVIKNNPTIKIRGAVLNSILKLFTANMYNKDTDYVLFKGVYSATRVYKKDELAIRHNVLYVALEDNITGGFDATKWVPYLDRSPGQAFGISPWSVATNYLLGNYTEYNNLIFRAKAANTGIAPDPTAETAQWVQVPHKHSFGDEWRAGLYLNGSVFKKNGKFYEVTIGTTFFESVDFDAEIIGTNFTLVGGGGEAGGGTWGSITGTLAEQTDLNTALGLRILTSAIVNDLTTGGTTVPASAETVKTLKGYIDAINTLLTSDDVNLDTIQELVDAIKANQNDLGSLNIASISGLSDALAASLVRSNHSGTQLASTISNFRQTVADLGYSATKTAENTYEARYGVTVVNFTITEATFIFNSKANRPYGAATITVNGVTYPLRDADGKDFTPNHWSDDNEALHFHLILNFSSEPHYIMTGVRSRTNTTFAASTDASLAINPIKPYGNNYAWTVSANGTLSFNNTSVPDGATGVITIIKSDSIFRYLGLGASVKPYRDVWEWLPDQGTSNITISSITDNGVGRIRIVYTGVHGFTTGDFIENADISGTFEAIGIYEVTVIDTTTVDLIGSSFTHAYVSGGTSRKLKKYLSLNQVSLAATYFNFVVRNSELVITSIIKPL